MARDRLLDQTGPFESWKEASDRIKDLMEFWIQDLDVSQTHANVKLAARLALFRIRLNRTAEKKK